MTWCGFIDLLGTKSSSNSSEQKLKTSLNAFHSSIKANQSKLEGGRCYAFSDGAFFESRKLENFVHFYKSLRNELFVNGYYFKCAVIPGDLETKFELEAGSGKNSAPTFFSVRFLGKAPAAFIAQENFKGIGATVLDPSGLKQSFVRSFYLSGDSERSVRPYTDIKYETDEIGLMMSNASLSFDEQTLSESTSAPGLVDIFVGEFSKAKTKSKRYGKYYLSALAAMARSADYSQIELTEGNWENYPYLFGKLLLERQFDISFQGITGLNLLRWTAVDEFLEQQPRISSELLEALAIVLSTRKGLFNEVDAVPDYILSAKHRELILAAKGRLETQKFRRRR